MKLPRSLQSLWGASHWLSCVHSRYTSVCLPWTIRWESGILNESVTDKLYEVFRYTDYKTAVSFDFADREGAILRAGG